MSRRFPEDVSYMREALVLARRAGEADEVPVGCLIVSNGRIIGRAGNRIRREKNPAAHAEVLAIQKAARRLNNERISGTVLYSTIEPCAMCAGAIVLARVARVVYGAKDPKTGACGSVFRVIPSKKLNHRPQLTSGVLGDECGLLIRDFFRRRR